MSSPPPRRLSPAVYRRRRLAVLAALIVVALIVGSVVWLLVARPWEGAAASAPAPSASASASGLPGPTPSPSASAAAEPEASADPAPSSDAVGACDEADILVEPLTDKDSYATGEQPQLTLRLTNRGTDACTLNVGTTQQLFTISSGNDVWWRSTDCQTEPSDMEVTLTAGQVVESAQPVPWDRTRSSVSTCEGDRQAATGGGASYHLAVSIGGIEGASTKQFLLY